MPPAISPHEVDEDYHSSSDSDFDANTSASSGNDSDASTDRVAANGKAKKQRVDADGGLEMGSGDEGIIAQGKRRKRKKGNGNGKAKTKDAELDEEEEDDGDHNEGVGIRVKLRSGRGGKEAVKKKASTLSAATVDIDSIWAHMNNPQASQPPPPSSRPSDIRIQQGVRTERSPLKDLSPSVQTIARTETVEVPHTYTFAGQTHTSTKTVPANSAEALAYLASKKKNLELSEGPALRRPLARKGLLEPNPSRLVRGLPSTPRADLPTSIGGNGAKSLAMQNKVSVWEGAVKKKKDVKLNTVEKSKLDWDQEVERQGLREELEKAEKSGTSYLGRMEFLGRTEDAIEEEGRRWRMAEKK
ncbi:MAG: hypothetical protein Q9217_003177 [Psora testacea]